MAPKKMLQTLVEAESEASKIIDEANAKASAVVADAQKTCETLRLDFQKQQAEKRKRVESTLRDEAKQAEIDSEKRVDVALKKVDAAVGAMRSEAVAFVVGAIKG